MNTQTKPTKGSAFNLKNYGPGLLTASAAIGGSHLIQSTKAGAMFGWQLVLLILLANLFKYPFFRFSVDYTYDAGHSLVEGYARKSKIFLVIFTLLAGISAMINTGALAMLSAVILKTMVSFDFLNDIVGAKMVVPVVAGFLLVISWLFTVLGRFKFLDGITKLIVIGLTICTIVAVAVAAGSPAQVQPDFVSPSPWNLATLAFLIALMGWMPAPIEVSAINSMWVSAKEKENPVPKSVALRDFNVGYIGTALLAVVFLALGALVFHGTGEKIAPSGFAFVPQLITLYSSTIGEWSSKLVSFIAFACIFGTTITVVDGYGRVLGETTRLFSKKPSLSNPFIVGGVSFVVVTSLIIIFVFASKLKDMLGFAMIIGFLAAPVFAWLNFSLAKEKGSAKGKLVGLAWVGLAFLTAFTLTFILWKFGIFKA